MVTKQEQLEWLAINYDEWQFSDAWVIMCPRSPMGFASRPGILITKKEWQQERDKMQNEKSVITGGIYLSRNGFMFEVVDIAKDGGDCSIDMVVYMNLDATNDFPPGQKWVLELESFISKFKLDSGRNLAPDNSWHERVEFPPPETYCQFKKANSEDVLVNCFVIGIDDLGFCVCRVDMDYHASISASDSRPLRTEREKAIDEMAAALINRGSAMSQVILGELYDAGFRMEKPQ